MKKLHSLLISLFLLTGITCAQEIPMTETASMEQVYIETFESDELLPMNDLDMESGYLLYQAEISVESPNPVLQLENVRDYAALYINDVLTGTMTDTHKRIALDLAPGTYTLQLYAENIGRITYGPEILDNVKGLSGSITLDGEEIREWEITPLNIRECEVKHLEFSSQITTQPCFYKGYFDTDTPADRYLDISGWDMGEVWVNGKYMGSYWEEEKQQSLRISAGDLLPGRNEIVVFELKNNGRSSMRFSDSPVFK
ncbi:MAG: hypothetical protein LUF04_08205 [Bacteroides sp.]|nr:hypothetical protein [Bacteroides sp.]